MLHLLENLQPLSQLKRWIDLDTGSAQGVKTGFQSNSRSCILTQPRGCTLTQLEELHYYPARGAKVRPGSSKWTPIWLDEMNSDLAQGDELWPNSKNRKHEALNQVKGRISYSNYREAMNSRLQLEHTP